MQFIKKIRQKFSNSKKPVNFYSLLGKENGLKELVKDFYEVMEKDPRAHDCLKVHDLFENKVLPENKDKLFMFLSGWLGGPNLFVENIGAPKMRMRHAHIKIGEKERVQWLYCMKQSVRNRKISKKEERMFINSLTALSLRIKNKD